MGRLIASLCVVLLVVSPVLCQEQVTRDLPLRYASAVELVGMFSEKAPPAPPGSDMDAFAKRCLSAAFADFPHGSGTWQTFCETQSDLRVASGHGGLAKMLVGLVGPPTIGVEPNSLRVQGTADAIPKFQEILALLDKPAKRLSLRVDVLRAADLGRLGDIDWNETSAKPDDGTAKVVRFARVKLLELLQQPGGAVTPAQLGSTVATRNNSIAEVRFAEVLPTCVVAQTGAQPTAAGYGRFVRFRLMPRLNADNSITLSVDSDFVASATQADDRLRLASPEVRQLLTTQCRLSVGETVLLGGLQTAREVSANPPPGGGILASLVLAVTPCVLAN